MTRRLASIAESRTVTGLAAPRAKSGRDRGAALGAEPADVAPDEDRAGVSPLRPVAEYLRVSTDRQSRSLSHQHAVLQAYAAANRFEIVQTYADIARSGVTMKGRTGLKALLGDVAAGASFSAILVHDVSRWGRFRDPDEAGHYEFLCRQAGVTVHYCAETFLNDGSVSDVLLKTAMRVAAGEYSRQLSERIRSGQRRQAADGMTHGGPAPYSLVRRIVEADGRLGRQLCAGEQRGDGQRVRLVPGPAEEVANVRRIFQLFTGPPVSLRAVAARLTAEGRTCRQKTWTGPAVRRVLSHPWVTDRTCGMNASADDGPSSGPADPTGADGAPAPIVSIGARRVAQDRLAVSPRRRWSDDAMIDALRRLLAGSSSLTSAIINRTPGVPCTSAYVARFGSLRAAYALVPYCRPSRAGPALRQRTGLPSGPRPGQHTTEGLKRSLTRLLSEQGYLSLRLIRQCPDLPTERYLYRHFGSLPAAYRAVGYVASRSGLIRAGQARAGLERCGRPQAPVKPGAPDPE